MFLNRAFSLFVVSATILLSSTSALAHQEKVISAANSVANAASNLRYHLERNLGGWNYDEQEALRAVHLLESSAVEMSNLLQSNHWKHWPAKQGFQTVSHAYMRLRNAIANIGWGNHSSAIAVDGAYRRLEHYY